jgi:Arc/MetJ-type ribon-helix-helix transcriptional regulator
MRENIMNDNKDTKGSKPSTPKAKKKSPEKEEKTKQSKIEKEDMKAKQGQAENEKHDQQQDKHQEKKRQSAFDEFGNQVEKIAVKTAESIRKVVDKALASRNTVLTIRVNDESSRKMSMLVDSGLFKSRSESAAFLIQEGIKNQDVLFKKISSKLDEIEKIREELQKVVSEEFSPEDFSDKS